MAAEYPGASWVPCPGFGFPTGTHGQNKPRWIILHGTASGDGTATQQARFFAGTSAHGVHFVIGKDGTVIQLVQLADAAYGNGIIQAPHDSWWTGNPNLCTISIEHCKTASDNSDILTPAQQDASFRLVKWLCDHLNIPARKADASGGITGHFSIEGIDRKNCPGAYPWQQLFDFLGGKNMVPQGWSDDGTALHNPVNSFVVTSRFREYVLGITSSVTWNPANIPLEDVHVQSPLEVSNPSLGDGQQQIFRFSALEMSPSFNNGQVFEAWIGQELLALRAQIANPPPVPAPQPSEADQWVALGKKLFFG